MNDTDAPWARDADIVPYADPVGRLEPVGVPLARFGAILRRHYLVVLLTIVLGVGGTVAIVTRLPRQYTADVSILMEPQRTQVSDLQAISANFGDTASLVRTQMDILRSPTLARNVVLALHLQDDPEFTADGGGLKARLSGWLHAALDGFATIGSRPGEDTQIEQAVAALEARIAFANEPRSSVLNVSVTTRRAELSAQVANALAQQYMAFKRREKFAAMQRASGWFESQLEGLAKRVHAEEVAVERYRAQHGLVDLPPHPHGIAAAATSVTGQQLSDVARQLGEVSRDLARKEAELAQATHALRERKTSALPEVLISPVIVQLLARQANVESREASLASSQGRNNPELIAAQAKTRNVQAAIVREMSNVVRSLSTEVSATRAQAEALRARMKKLVGAVGTENLAEIGLRSLEDKTRATRTIYESFLTRATELANVAGIQEPDATLVSTARPPLGPSGPRRLRLIVVAGMVSTVLGIALAAAIERSRRGFSSADQVEATLGLPVMALAPKLPRRSRNRPLTAQGSGDFAGALANLRSRLRLAGPGRPQIVMVSSAMAHEGKSVLAAAMAANAAAVGRRVLLVECDFHRPSIAKKLGVAPRAGLSDLLADRLGETDQPVIRCVRPSLDAILAGKGAGDPQELLSSHRMDDLLGVARTCYDLIVLDTPPLLPTPDALALARHADATLLVVRWEKTPRTAAQDALRLLRESDARILGAVLTQVDLRTSARLAGRPPAVYDYGRARA